MLGGSCLAIECGCVETLAWKGTTCFCLLVRLCRPTRWWRNGLSRDDYDHWAPAPEDGADVDVQAAEGADAEAAAMDEWDEWQAWNEWVAENAEPRFEVPRSSSSVIPHSPAAG